MLQQAILDLPVIEFENHRHSLSTLQVFCASNYGLIGLKPPSDAIFHFTASLWRFRADESLFQVAALSSEYLLALSDHIAAKRRLSAARQSDTDLPTDTTIIAVDKAEIHLDRTSDRLSDAGGVLSQFYKVSDSRRIERNIELMRQGTWIHDLETLCAALRKHGQIIKHWHHNLVDVLDNLAEHQSEVLAVLNNGNGHGKTAVLNRLRKEVSDYQQLASDASIRLSEVNRERKELEELLSSRETGNADQSIALEDARHALDVTLANARDRLGNLEESEARGSESLTRKVSKLESDNTKLADELLHSETQATSGAADTEELLEKLEQAIDEREDAALTIDQLSQRLKLVQEEADIQLQQLEGSRKQEGQKAKQLESTVDNLRTDIVRSEADLQEAKAVISTLEAEKARQSEYDDLLTASEARVLDAENELEKRNLHIEQLKNIAEAKQEEIGDLESNLQTRNGSMTEISTQLAEAENLIQGHSGRINNLEEENERLRRDLSDAQGQMLSAKGDLEEATNKESDARSEIIRLEDLRAEEKEEEDLLKEELETSKLEIATLSEMAEEAHQNNEGLAQALETIREEHQGLQAKMKTETEKLDAVSDEAENLRSQISAKEASLKEAEESLSAKTSNAEELTSESANLKYEIEKLANELENTVNKESETRTSLVVLKTESVELEQELVAAKENESASREAAQDRELKLREKLELLEERIKNADKEKQAFLDALQTGEYNRRNEKSELESVIDKLRTESQHRHKTMLEAQQTADSFKGKLDESDSFVIQRERELEKINVRKDYLEEEIRAVADLRSQFENAANDKKRDDAASQISRRLDGLFSEVGRPVHADRRTEKILVLHVKKTDEEIESDSKKDFVATNAANYSNDDNPSETSSNEAQSTEE